MNPDERQNRVPHRCFYNHQYAAMALAVTTIALCAVRAGARGFVGMLATMILVLPCILWPDAMGSITGPRFSTEPSHPGVLSFTAWVLLLVFFALALARLF